MSSTRLVVFVVVWVAIGLVTGLWMARRGHDPSWTLVAVVLGPLFVPIALERVERRPRLAAPGPGGPVSARPMTASGPRVLMGLDGSPESQQALDATLALLGTHCGLLVLAEVVSYDATDGDSREVVDAARERLADAATRAVGIPVTYEVLAGPPGATLRRFAEEHDMDLLVVGRRGRGVSTRLLGSVSADLVQHASVPVLVVEPTPAGRSSSPNAGQPGRRMPLAGLAGTTSMSASRKRIRPQAGLTEGVPGA